MHVIGQILIGLFALACLAGVWAFWQWRMTGLWPWQKAASSTPTKPGSTRSSSGTPPAAPK